MLRLAMIVVVALLGVGVGFAVNAWLGETDGGQPAARGAPKLERMPYGKGEGPAFYLDLDTEGRLLKARKSLNGLTSVQATAMSGLRDGIALLCDDPRVRAEILEDFEQRAHLTKAEGAGFAELFYRVRNPDFVLPTIELLTHFDSVARRNAVNAARTQADPRLTPALLQFYERLQRERSEEGDLLRAALIEAGMACGGDQLPRLLQMGLNDPLPTARRTAAEAIMRLDLRSMLPHVRKRFAVEEFELARVSLARTLAGMGDPAGAPALIESLSSADRMAVTEAARAIAMAQVKDALPKLIEIFDPNMGFAAHDVLACALKLGDRTLLNRMIRDDGDGPLSGLTLFGLASLCAPEDVEVLVDQLRRYPNSEVHAAVALGMDLADVAPPEALYRTLIESGVLKSNNMFGGWITKIPESEAGWLDEELAAATNISRAHLLIALLGSLPGEEGRKRLIAWRDRYPKGLDSGVSFRRLLDQGLRLQDINRLKRGTVDAPPIETMP